MCVMCVMCVVYVFVLKDIIKIICHLQVHESGQHHFYCVIKEWPVLFNWLKTCPHIINIESLLRSNRCHCKSVLIKIIHTKEERIIKYIENSRLTSKPIDQENNRDCKYYEWFSGL